MASMASASVAPAGFSYGRPPFSASEKLRRTVVVRAEAINPGIRKTEDKMVDSVVITELNKPLTAYCSANSGHSQGFLMTQ
nr:CDGSH iron-sulfur domain-containing protein NEET-like isoform X2 [Coffea arabica]